MQSIRPVERQVLHHGAGVAVFPADLPSVVADWFEALRLLKTVPFHYLVPQEGLLPPESIRFFQVNPLLLEQLQAGAFGVGHVAAAPAPQQLPAAPTPDQPLCGFSCAPAQ